MTYNVHIEGIGDCIHYFTKVSKDFPLTADDISRTLATDTRTRARQLLTQRLSQKRRGYGSPNITRTLESSMMVWQANKGHWVFRPWSGIAEMYGPLQEAGGTIHGWHFLPIKGAGRLGEGISLPGGSIKIPPKWFVTDAVNSTVGRSDSIIEREMNKLLR